VTISRARAHAWDGITVAQVLAMPPVLIGCVDQIVADVVYRRENFGVSYYGVSDDQMEELAPSVARVAEG
jgi:hypothetical protein